jgi:hypothetical protein
MDVDLAKNLSVEMDLTALGEAAEKAMRATGLPTDPCAHLIFQPMPYCEHCLAHKRLLAKGVADRIDALALDAIYGGHYGRR